MYVTSENPTDVWRIVLRTLSKADPRRVRRGKARRSGTDLTGNNEVVARKMHTIQKSQSGVIERTGQGIHAFNRRGEINEVGEMDGWEMNNRELTGRRNRMIKASQARMRPTTGWS